MTFDTSTLFAVFFYAFAGLLVVSALRVITARNPVHAALFLVLAFFCASGLWMLLKAEFLSLALILVYVGAVMVLFLFVVMMLDLDLEHLRRDFKKFLPVAFLMATSNTQALGMLIFVDYVYAFEVAGVILLVAIIAAVALTLRNRKDSKSQNIHEQVNVNSADRMRIVKMGSDMAAKQDARGEKK
jgi:NADH-quinone oxidoreductase subunit J